MNLVQSIAEKRLITFVYGGHPRVVEPHTFGMDKDDRHVLVGYQVGGTSASGRLGWKNFYIDSMRNLALSENRFHAPRREYQRDDRALKSIIAQL